MAFLFAGTVYGDPHITTFDGKSYYFGGSGDFWILKSDSLNIQGRFESRQNKGRFTSASGLYKAEHSKVFSTINSTIVQKRVVVLQLRTLLTDPVVNNLSLRALAMRTLRILSRIQNYSHQLVVF
jgi:hypothetical protein